MYVNDEYTAKQMALASNKLGKKLGNDIEMMWQWVKNGKKMFIACDFHKYDDESNNGPKHGPKKTRKNRK